MMTRSAILILLLLGVGEVFGEITVKVQFESGRWYRRDTTRYGIGSLVVVHPEESVESNLLPEDIPKFQVVAFASFRPQGRRGEDLKNPVNTHLEVVSGGQFDPISPGYILIPRTCTYRQAKTTILRRSYIRVECSDNGAPRVVRIYRKLRLDKRQRKLSLYSQTAMLSVNSQISAASAEMSDITAPQMIYLDFSGRNTAENGSIKVNLKGMYTNGNLRIQETRKAQEDSGPKYTIFSSDGKCITDEASSIGLLSVRIANVNFEGNDQVCTDRTDANRGVIYKAQNIQFWFPRAGGISQRTLPRGPATNVRGGLKAYGQGFFGAPFVRARPETVGQSLSGALNGHRM